MVEKVDALVQFVLETVRMAGDQALSYYGKGQPEMKFDEGLVTETELKVTEFFQERLQQRFPDHQMFNFDHIKDDYTHDDKRYLWIFDAVDGVSNIQAGIPVWGVSLALLENFWPIVGAFYMPATGDLFHARAGGKAYWNEREITTRPQSNINDESLLLIYSRFHQRYHSTFPGKIRNLGCTAAHICYVATGRADAAIITNESFEGLAAGRVIIEAAGGKIFKIDGTEFHLNEYIEGVRINEPLIVGSPEIIPQVIASLKPVQ